MNKTGTRIWIATFLLTFLLAPHTFGQITVDVSLSPAGSFKIEIPSVQGGAVVRGDQVMAQNVVADLRTLKTGIALRDSHTKQRLGVEPDRSVASSAPGFPHAKLIRAVGKNGKGKALIEIKGQRKEFSGTYEIKGDRLIGEFSVHLPDLNITGVKYMGVGVRDDVTVTVNLPVTRQ